MVAYGASGTIDLGNDPPLAIGGKEEDDTAHFQRAVSWRWLTGTVLTGFTSIALMGAALVVAVSSPNQFASLPDSLVARAIDAGSIIFGRKGDRLHPTEERVSSRQILQVSTVTHQGERDFVKLKPFVRVNATLAADPKLASEVPTYDPLAIFADTTTPDVATSAAATVTVASAEEAAGQPLAGEVSVKVDDFPVAGADLDPAITLGAAEVEQIVRATAHLGGDNGDALSLSDALDVSNNATDVKIVPENVSNIAKSDAGVLLNEGYRERMIAISKPENLREVFSESGVTGDEADEIIAALSQLVDVSRLRPGQKVRIALAADSPLSAADQAALDGDPATNAQAAAAARKLLRPIRVSIYDHGAHQATVARSDDDQFVRADEPSAIPEVYAEAPAVEEPPAGGPPTLYEAVYETALAQQMSKPMIDQLIRVFAYDVDLQSRIGTGDSLEVFHSLPEPDVKGTGEPDILYAALNLGGVAKRYYRFRTPDDGIVDYYDQDGRSAKKFLVRKPTTAGRITSNFGWRVHPILGYRRLHAGVDYGAPRGTPILAAGDGVVASASRSSGYGNLTVIRHTNGYETRYGHQSAFAKGLKPGMRVHQGQVIGYVGSTGLSTGPHLHFEIRVNGKPVDPLRIRLPRGRALDGDYLATFEQERTRIDDLLGNGGATTQPTTLASLDPGSQ